MILVLLELRLLAPNSWRAIGVEVQCIEKKEREALLRFKASLGDDSSLVRWSSWGRKEYKKACCEWEGLVCNNQTSHVIKLHLPGDFPNSPLESSIPEFLGYLSCLRYLNHQEGEALWHGQFGCCRQLPPIHNKLSYTLCGPMKTI
ncbi:hypothetical protein K1719_028956 [Acacia pycnantha]|nr:hypothetical protein K1719_028956 [Acacia pycnantha]